MKLSFSMTVVSLKKAIALLVMGLGEPFVIIPLGVISL